MMFAKRFFLVIASALLFVCPVEAGKFTEMVKDFMGSLASSSSKESPYSSSDCFSDSDGETETNTSSCSDDEMSDGGSCFVLGGPVVLTWEAATISAHAPSPTMRRRKGGVKRDLGICAELAHIASCKIDKTLLPVDDVPEIERVDWIQKVHRRIKDCSKLLEEIDELLSKNRRMYCIDDARMSGRDGESIDLSSELVALEPAYSAACDLLNACDVEVTRRGCNLGVLEKKLRSLKRILKSFKTQIDAVCSR